MKANRAFWSGIFGGILISILLAAARLFGLADLHVEMFVGTFATTPGMNAFAIGAVMHLLFAGLLGLFYGRIFEAVRRSGGGIGAVVGLIHAVIVGLVLGVIAAVHPQLDVTIADPGFFAVNYGAGDVIVLFVTHILYGVLLGILYEKPLSTGATDYKRV